MRNQKGLDKKQFINVQPRYLIVPAALETVAEQFLQTTAFVAAINQEKNPLQGESSP